MARTLSAELLAKQKSTQRKPAIRVLINSVDYSDRLLFVEHHEEPYRDYATIILNNSDRGLDAVSTLVNNLLGYRFRIAYGYVTGEVVAEPNGDGATKEYVETADMWVKSQQIISSGGLLVCQLYCEGQWNYMREQRVMALSATGVSFDVFDPDVAVQDEDISYSAIFDKTHTVYELFESLIEGAMGWTLDASPSPDDGILNTFKPVFSLEQLPSAASLIYNEEYGVRTGLITMTKCFIRPKANLVWEIIYPQTGDDIDEVYLSASGLDEIPFEEYVESLNLLIPNRVVLFCNSPDGIDWSNIIVGDSGVYSGVYGEVLDYVIDTTIDNQQDADLRVEAILARYKAELLAGYLIVPHDVRVELYDRVRVQDNRGA